MSNNPVVLTKDQIAIMGRPNFACAHIADKLINSGVYADGGHKAEYKQAVFMHFTLRMLEDHQGEWTEAANNELERLAKLS